MKTNVIVLTIIVSVILSLTMGIPLFAQQSKQQTAPATEAVKIQPQQQKQSTDPIKKIGPPPKPTVPKPDTRFTLPGPKINEFSCEIPTSGYYNYTFFRTVGGPPEKIRVIFNIYANQGLSKFEIIFNGHTVHEEAFGGPPVSSRSSRNTMISIQPYKPATSGNYTLQAKVTDRHGESVTKSITLPIDFQAPGFPTIRPAAGDTIYYTVGSEHMDVTFWITSSDDFSGIKEVRVQTSGTVYRGSDTTSPYSITVRNVLISEADEWSILITDNAGNTRSVLAHTINVAPRRASMPATRP